MSDQNVDGEFCSLRSAAFESKKISSDPALEVNPENVQTFHGVQKHLRPVELGVSERRLQDCLGKPLCRGHG